MNIKHFPLVTLFIILVGCGTVPTSIQNITTLMHDNENFDNKPVQLSGYVTDHEYRGYRFMKWHFTVSDGQSEIGCYEKGYNRYVLKRSIRMVAEAAENEEEITVIGVFRRTPYDDSMPDFIGELELTSVEYKGRKIYTDYNDFDPYLWGYHHRSHFHHHGFHRHCL